MPPRKHRLMLAQELNLKENQVYKWFWELKQKQEELEEVQPATRDISEFTLMEKFDVFVNKDLKQYRDQIRLKGNELGGRHLSDEEMTTAIKLYLQSTKVDECDYVAHEIGFNIDQATDEAINDNDFYQQIIRIELGNSRAVSKQSSFRFRKQSKGNSSRFLLSNISSSGMSSKRQLLQPDQPVAKSNNQQQKQMQQQLTSSSMSQQQTVADRVVSNKYAKGFNSESVMTFGDVIASN